MPPLVVGEELWLLGGGIIAAFGWYMPGGGKDQVERALTPETTPPVMQMSPAEQSDHAESEAGKEQGAATQVCPTCPPAQGDPAPAQDAPAQGSNKMPPLPANPEDLLKQGWDETTDPRAAANSNRRTFRNPQTGQEIEFDKGNLDRMAFVDKTTITCRIPK